MCFALKINQREKRKENKRKTNLKKVKKRITNFINKKRKINIQYY